MTKPVKVIFSEEAEKVYSYLKENKSKHSRMLFSVLNKKIQLIKNDMHYGNPIAKRLIPKEYKVNNLFRVELPDFWRMLYTLSSDDIVIIAFVIDILNHKEYNKIFRYKNI